MNTIIRIGEFVINLYIYIYIYVTNCARCIGRGRERESVCVEGRVFVRSLVVANTSPPMLGGKFENSHGSIIYQRWYKNRNNRNEESIFKRNLFV